MNVQKIPLQQNLNLNLSKNRQPTPNFTGGMNLFTQGLNFLNTNPAWGATFTDFGFMVAPRTIVDFTRGPEAGVETMRRESTGTINHALIGIYGLLAGAALSIPFNHAYGIKAHKIFAGNDMLEMFGKIWHQEVRKEDPLKGFLKKSIDSIEGFDNEWKKIGETDKKPIIDLLYDEIKNKKKFSKEGRKTLKSIITNSLMSENHLRLNIDGKTLQTTTEGFLDDICGLSKTFMQEKVSKVFKDSATFDSNVFIKNLKKLNMRRSALGIAIGAGLGMCIQPLNIYLTKRKTGSDGFVGVEGRKKDDSKAFKGLKALAAAGFGVLTAKVIGGKISEIPKKIQFKGMAPTLNQFKLVYGLTIMSRLLAARDKDELREATIKDTLGYLNWLVLGNFVTKIVAKALDKDLIQNTDLSLKGFRKFLNSHVLSHGEILAKIKTTSIAKTKIRHLNIAQCAGYIYSGAVLGMGIPKLNIGLTKAMDKKRSEKKQAILFNPSNINFLSNKFKNENFALNNIKN